MDSETWRGLQSGSQSQTQLKQLSIAHSTESRPAWEGGSGDCHSGPSSLGITAGGCLPRSAASRSPACEAFNGNRIQVLLIQ